MRILLISYYFPPSNAMGTIRTGKAAKYLASLGHDVRVLTASEQGSFEQTLPVELDPDVVYRIRWPTSDRLAALILANRRAALARGETPTGIASSALSRLGTIYRAIVHFPDEAAVGLAHAYAAAARLVRAWRPDVIFATASPYSALILAAALSRRFAIPWVGELRDPWTDNHLYPYGSLRRRLEAAIERRVLRTANGLVTVSEPLAEGLRQKHGRPTAVVLNGFDPPDYSPEAHPDARLPLRVVYTGQIFPARQDPMPLVEAVHRLGEPGRDVQVSFYGRYLGLALQDTMRRAAELGVADSFTIERAVPHREALRRQREADVLLLLTWNDHGNRGVYTGKLFEYAGARRPILAVGCVPTVADELIREKRLGVTLGDPDRIADQLGRWLEAKRSGVGIPSISAECAAGLTRREQTEVLANFLERAAGLASPAVSTSQSPRPAAVHRAS